MLHVCCGFRENFVRVTRQCLPVSPDQKPIAFPTKLVYRGACHQPTHANVQEKNR